ncbi:MAG: type I restriction endonuclease, partial [Bacteroidota bacterium]
MTSQTNEPALERAIEQALTGTKREELTEAKGSANPTSSADALNPQAHDGQAEYGPGEGYYLGLSEDFDWDYVIDEKRFWHFLESTQAEELKKLQRSGDWKLKIVQRYDRMVKKYGLLRLLRKGLEVEDAHFTLFYELPLASSSQRVQQRFEQNEFSVTRQVFFNREQPRQSIDMVIFLNGMAIATLELKNHWTGQNARVHGQRQYKRRDHRQPIFQFGRCIVHMTVDTDEVYMTTRVNGNSTYFLPFNQGYNHGKGNPVNPFGHRSAYLWEEVFRRESLANLLQHFVRFDGKAKDPLSSKTLFFPRYHQMDVVRKVVAHTRENGVGHTYLIQHSAGSGKSYSITWAAYQLIEVYL